MDSFGKIYLNDKRLTKMISRAAISTVVLICVLNRAVLIWLLKISHSDLMFIAAFQTETFFNFLWREMSHTYRETNPVMNSCVPTVQIEYY